jgi:hypothetical protein
VTAGAHAPPPERAVERGDAEFGLTVAMALRRFVGPRMLDLSVLSMKR